MILLYSYVHFIFYYLLHTNQWLYNIKLCVLRGCWMVMEINWTMLVQYFWVLIKVWLFCIVNNSLKESYFNLYKFCSLLWKLCLVLEIMVAGWKVKTTTQYCSHEMIFEIIRDRQCTRETVYTSMVSYALIHSFFMNPVLPIVLLD